MSLFARLIAPLAFTLALPVVAHADNNQTSLLQSNTSINFETGNTNAATNDMLWNGTTLALQGNATAVRLYPDFPEEQYAFITSIQIQLTPGYSKNSITPAVGDLIGVHTNGNHWVRLFVKAKSGSSITLRFTTFGVAQGSGGSGAVPTITDVLNNSSRIPKGLPNSGIAPSSIFVVIGSGLSDPGTPVLQDSQGAGIPLTLNGTSLSVTVNGVTTRPGLYYSSPGQLAAVLPATTPTGSGTVTVTYKGVASNAFAIQVVPAALGINVYQGNTAVATDALTGTLLTYGNSGTPGQILTLWTTGLGANPNNSDTTFTTTPQAVNTSLQIYIGGIAARILYQGASVYPGVNQINIVIPNDAPNGCWVPLAAVAGGVLANVATLPVNSNGGACVDEVTGLTTSQLTAGGTGTIHTGVISLIQSRTTENGAAKTTSSANAAFQRYSSVYTPSNSVSPGSCIINDQTPVSTAETTGLDAGAITLTGPAALSATLAPQLGLKGFYSALLTEAAIPGSGGAFSFRGAAGTDVGAFTVNLNLSPLFSWTNQAALAMVNRTQGIRVTWNGGNPGTYVFITGTSASTAGAPAGFTCLAPIAAGEFFVPPYILSALPAGRGAVELQNYIYAPLTASGLDIALALADIASTVTSVYQ
ncbi:MAG: hypothetical protein IT168_18685 [Bryobacterales bacterium]|nr:hypothetical protein [Bryobacterales bacterium]